MGFYIETDKGSMGYMLLLIVEVIQIPFLGQLSQLGLRCKKIIENHKFLMWKNSNLRTMQNPRLCYNQGVCLKNVKLNYNV